MDEDGDEYQAIALRCRACEARDEAASRFQRDNAAAGLYFIVQRAQRIYY